MSPYLYCDAKAFVKMHDLISEKYADLVLFGLEILRNYRILESKNRCNENLIYVKRTSVLIDII